MSALRQLRNFWILLVTTSVLACFSLAAGKVGYKVTDLGVLNNGFFGCAMGLNNHGWTETQYGLLNASGQLVKGQVAINLGGLTLDLDTLGGPNSWDSPFGGEINDRGEAVGYSETSVLDPDGEDICGFGTHLTCRPFLWRYGQIGALPTLGGNNGQASAMNNRGQIVGFAENGIVDSTCPPNTTNNRIALPVLWENGKAQALATVDREPDGIANGINDRGEAVGYTGTCTAALHAVLWEKDGTAVSLPDLGAGGASYGINNRGQIVGAVVNPDGTVDAALWQNGANGAITITNLGTLLPGDVTAYASGINDKGQVVGSDQDSSGTFVHAFIYEGGVMTNLDTLFPASSNLYPTMANSINSAGQIAGMATVTSGPHTGETHAFLATPVNASMGRSVADVASTHPKSNLPANVRKQLLQRFRLGHPQ